MTSLAIDLLWKLRSTFLLPRKFSTPWLKAQKLELGSAISHMGKPSFEEVLEKRNSSKSGVSTGYVDPTLLSEFFSDDIQVWNEFVEHIRGRRVLEIGPCLIAEIGLWDVASERIAIEPLFDEVRKYQQDKFGMTGFSNVRVLATPAEKLVPELMGKIDGAVYVRNCIDHSPYWAFILSNISRYLAQGGQLLLWNDLTHSEGSKDRHYDICDDEEMFRNLIVSFGFEIVAEWQLPRSGWLNFGCRAVKL